VRGEGAGAGFRAVMGPSAMPEAAAPRPGARDSPQLLLLNRGTASFPGPTCSGQPGTTEDKALTSLGPKFLW